MLAAVDDLQARAAALADGSTVNATIERAFAGAGVDGCLHVVDIDRGHEVDVAAGTPVVMASTFKVPLHVALHRSADAGDLCLEERIRVPAKRTSGWTGLGAMQDEAELSLRDLALSMITVSDNAAADVVLERVGLAALRTHLDALGMTTTSVVASCREQSEMLAGDFARLGQSPTQAGTSDRGFAGFRSLDPEATNRTTPRDMTRLLAQVWRDEAADATACAEVRRALRLQVSRHRLAAGFPDDHTIVGGKTGTLLNLRCEVGVVERSAVHRFAVAVFTRAHNPSLTNAAADAVIGRAARLAIDELTMRTTG